MSKYPATAALSCFCRILSNKVKSLANPSFKCRDWYINCVQIHGGPEVPEGEPRAQMDPLSVTASTIAIVGVSVQAARCIAKLKAVKELPGEFRLLLSEVSNLHEVLSECCLVNQQHGSNNGGPEKEQSKPSKKSSALLAQVQRAGSKLEELETSILAKINHATRREELKALWAGLVHGRQSLQNLRAELEDIRLALSFAIGASTSYALFSIIRRAAHIHDLCHSSPALTCEAPADRRWQESRAPYKMCRLPSVNCCNCNRFYSRKFVSPKIVPQHTPTVKPEYPWIFPSTLQTTQP